MSILYDEPPIAVSPTLATALGLNAAVFLQQLHYWLEQKKLHGARYQDSYYEGYFWVYNTLEEWREQMPFLGSLSTIKRMLADLKEKKILVIACHNRVGFDKTSWYRIDYPVLYRIAKGQNESNDKVKMNSSMGQNDLIDGSKWTNGEVQNEPTYTRDFPETSSKTSTKTTTTRAEANFFEEPDPPPNDSPHNQDSLVAAMMALPSPSDSPLSLHQAQKLLQRYGPEACKNQLDWLPCHNPHNAVAFFQSALKNNLPPPKTWLDYQAEAKRRQREEEEAQRRRQERAMMREMAQKQLQEQAAEREAWAKLSPQEKQAIMAERDRQRRESNPFTKMKADLYQKMEHLHKVAPPKIEAPGCNGGAVLEQVFNLNTCLEAS